MGKIVQVGGLITVKVDYGEGLQDLGYTRNGVQYIEESFWGDVPGDENGGDDGPPIDVQFFGEVHRIRAEFTKYDSEVAAKVAAKVAGGVAGVPGAPGTLMFAGGKTMRVVCTGTPPAGTSHTRSYLTAIPRMPIELNVGTKFSTLVIEFEAHKPPGSDVLYNTTAT